MRIWRIMAGMGAAAAIVAGYTAVMARAAPGSPPPTAPPEAQADAILVDKSDRRLWLLRDGVVIAEYPVSLGGAPEGHKQREGDERTPVGDYLIDWRNARSIAHLSLHISYPDAEDRARAAAAGVPPGGDLMIHGLPNGWGFLGVLHLAWDWTDGCIAVTNGQMREIWALVPDGTPITIRE